jgi:phosphoribosylformylglycinamidine synthase
VAVTDCLNFGNPEKGDIYWTFEQAVDGMAEACEAFDTPVVSGNVSFYNESFGNAIYPTPMVGMLGLLDDVTRHCDGRFKAAGDRVFLLGPAAGARLDGSEYQKVHFGRVAGRVPDVDLVLEVELQRVLRAGIAAGLIKSAHDCAEGGLAVALAECCIASGACGGALTAAPPPALGAALALPAGASRPDLALFGEGPSRVVVTCAAADAEALARLVGGLPLTALGTVGSDRLRIALDGGVPAVDLSVADLHKAYESLPERLA